MRIFLAAQTLSAAGDAFSYVAMPLLVLHVTGSATQMGLITALAGAASLVSGIFAGSVADRFSRRGLLIGCDIARFMLYASIPLAWLSGPQLWLLYLISPLAACFSMLARVTEVTVVPSLVPKDQIIKANSRLFGATSAAFLAGPALAGMVSGAFGPHTAIAVDAASFALCALALTFIRFSAPPSAAVQERGFLAGARFLWRQPVLRALTCLLALFTSVTAGLTDVFIFKAKHDLAQPDRVVGYIMAASFVGTLLASVAVPKVRQWLGFGASWIGSSVLCGLAVLSMAYARQPVTMAIVAATVLFCTGIAGICSMSLRQEITPAPLLGRVTSAFWTVHGVLNPAGIAVLTASADRYGTTSTLFAAGSAIVLIALTGLLTPVFTHQLARPAADQG